MNLPNTTPGLTDKRLRSREIPEVGIMEIAVHVDEGFDFQAAPPAGLFPGWGGQRRALVRWIEEASHFLCFALLAVSAGKTARASVVG
jgi:hypothetical protein